MPQQQMRPGAAVKRALAQTEWFTPEQVAQFGSKAERAKERARAEEQVKRGMLGIEEVAKKRADARVASNNRRASQLTRGAKFAGRYGRLSLKPLTWRDKNGLPQLIPFTLDSPNFKLHAIASREGRWDTWGDFVPGGRLSVRMEMSPKLPDAVTECYKDVQARLKEQARKNKKSVRLSCRFQGVIPADVKEKIAAARKDFSTILVIAEPAKGFTITEKAPRVPVLTRPVGDPLVVGVDGDQLWLIADFDTTTVEEAMKAARLQKDE